jgi:hypothetical protein
MTRFQNAPRAGKAKTEPATPPGRIAIMLAVLVAVVLLFPHRARKP